MARTNHHEIRRGIIGRCPALLQALELAEQVAPHRLAVLVQGETGTGKEAVARLIHAASGRTGAFIALNCAALTDTLLESELFGHERGSFTGAVTSHRGAFEAADGGTLFLDEIGELPALAQAKLLRVLQEQRVRRVGSTSERPVDVRVVSATHVDLERAIDTGRFRMDLRYRLAEITVALPPLRERHADIGLLADHVLRSEPALRGRRLTPAARQHLMTLPLLGNVRELRSLLLAAGFQEPVGPITLGQHGTAEARVLELLATGDLSAGVLQKEVQASRPTLNRLLRSLERAGRVQRIGDGAATLWRRA